MDTNFSDAGHLTDASVFRAGISLDFDPVYGKSYQTDGCERKEGNRYIVVELRLRQTENSVANCVYFQDSPNFMIMPTAAVMTYVIKKYQW